MLLSASSTPAKNSTDTFLHSTKLKSLNNGAMHVYIVGSESDGWSPTYSFIAPHENTHPTFGILGWVYDNHMSKKALSMLSSLSLISRFHALVMFYEEDLAGTMYQLDLLQASVPLLRVPYGKQQYYSLRYANIYFIFLNTNTFDEE